MRPAAGRGRERMLLTLSTSHQPATELGFLLHKHPDRAQQASLSFGTAHLFYPEANEQRCTFALLLEVDPVALVRGRGGASAGLLDQYVNDRPYVGSSFLSVALSRILGTALGGRCTHRPGLAAAPAAGGGSSRYPAAAAAVSSAGCSSRSATKSGPSRCPWTRPTPSGVQAPSTP